MLEEFVEALRPFLKEGAFVEVAKVYHHHFVRVIDSGNHLCFSATCDDEENAWIEFKEYKNVT
jgi:hypothetical protein